MVGTLELPCAVIAATMTSLAAVATGRLIASEVALPALPLLALAAPWNAMLVAPGQVSATSHSFAAERHTTPALPAGCVQVALVPLHTSAVQGSPSSVQAVLLGWKALVGQVELVPVQLSVTSHSLTAARHTVPAFPAGCVHVALVPLHTSVVHTLPSSVQVVPLALKASVGQAVVTPSQVSARSHSPAAARQTVPAALSASAGQAALVPVQFSAASHRSTAARQTVLEDRKPSAGQLVLVPVQVSAASHGPTAARHAAPAFPAGCLQVALAPSHWSRVQGLASAVQAVPLALKTSGGQAVLEPSQVSAVSHSPAAARQTAPAFPAGCVHVTLVPSHRSVVQGLPSSVQAVPAALTTSAGHAALEPVQLSATSHPFRAARQIVPLVTKRHEAEQQEPAVPFDAP